MDFFERQEKARRNTKLLVLYFVAGVALLIATIYLAVFLIFAGVGSSRLRQYEFSERPSVVLWNPGLFFGVAVGTLAVIAMGSAFKTMELSQGGSAVAEMLGGRLLNSNSTDPDERKLLNVVEEMSLASGVPVPRVYVLDNEKGINAFAAGHSTSDAAVTVTRGCMKLLNRDELQGVIGHEFSHILNGDMRLNIRLMGILFGILCLAVIGRVLLYTRGGRSSRDRNALPLLGLALLLVGWVGVFFGRLIQAAVSRQREFLADASSVQFTRNPAGLSGALKKIGGLSWGSKLEAAHAAEASHMFFGNGVSEPLFGLLATHPPLEDRIRAIDPAWDGNFATVSAGEERGSDLATEKDAQQRVPTGLRKQPPIPFPFPAWAGLGAAQRVPTVPPVITAQAVMPNLGTPTTAHLRHAVELREAFPPAVQNAARDPLGASALIYGLLMSSEPEMRKKQLQLLAECASDAIRRETERLLPDVESVATRAKLPLIDLALPALRHFSAAQYQQFSIVIQRLIECDGEIDLFEYVLQKIVLRHLDPQFKGARKPVTQYYALRPLAPDCAVLLSAVACVGADDPAQVEAAFQQGAQRLSSQAQTALALVAGDQCDLPQVDAALNRLCQAAPQIKKNVLNACAQTVAADGVIQEAEAELLRAIADTLDCPIPPFLEPKAEAA
jgi:Zn-dependent protease with chaperone function